MRYRIGKSNVGWLAAVGGLALALLAPPVLAQQPAPVKVRIVMDWILQGPQAIYLRAAESGCFASKGLDVTIDRGYGAGDSVAKVAGGQYDLGRSDGNVVIEFVAKNPGRAVVAFFDTDSSSMAITTLKKSKLAKPADLEGKTIAAPAGDASRRLFPTFAVAAKIDPAKVKWSNISPELREPALVRGDADAITGLTESALLSLKAIGVPLSDLNVFMYDDFGTSLLGKALVVNTDFAKRHPAAVTSVIDCLVTASKEAMTHLGPAIDALKKREPFTDVAIETERLKISMECCWLTPNVKANGFSSMDTARLKDAVERVSKALGVPPPDVAAVYTDAYLPDRAVLKAAQ
jgi:NitT/TauT family transport system substrate-binding protein